MSEIILTLQKIEEELVSLERNVSLASFDLGMCDESFRYYITPPDLIPFARTGGNGIHFGFLTDFGQVTNLEDAWIVCVSPMHSPDTLQFVARNIIEFLSIVCKITLAEELININFENDERDWIADTHEERREGAEVSDEDATLIINTIKNHLQLPNIPSIYEYIQSIRTERNHTLSFKTIDGMGILRTSNSLNSEPVEYHYDFHDYDIKQIVRYLNQASHDEKLAFCRTAISSRFLTPTYDAELQILVADTLLNLGFHTESEIVRKNQ